MKKILIISLAAIYLLGLPVAFDAAFAQPAKTATMSMSHTGGNTVPLDSTREFTVNVNVNTGGSQSAGFDITITYNATQVTYKSGSLTFTSFYNGTAAGPVLSGSGSSSKIFFGKQGSATSGSGAVASLVFAVASGVTSTTLMCDSYYSGTNLVSQTADNVSVYDNTGSYDLLSAQPASVTFTFTDVIPAPDIASVNPNSGTTAGGTSVVISGANFGTSGTVTFGGTAATSTSGWAATSITAVAPAHAAGLVYVVVTTGGQSSGSADPQAQFTYTAPSTTPNITGIDPTSGPAAGNTSVTITGTNFGATQGTSSVRFGSTNATSITSWSATSIVAVSPSGTGTVQVTVVTSAGTSNGVSFTYTTATTPNITNISPNQGSENGGTSVVLTGTNFGTTKGMVSIGGTTVSASNVTWTSATSINFTTPAYSVSADAAVYVFITTSGGQTSNNVTFTYLNEGATSSTDPTISNVSPSSGRADTAVLVTITGTNFKPSGYTTGTVKFGPYTASNIVDWTDTQIKVWAPQLGAISADITYVLMVTRSNDGKSATSSYTYLAPVSTGGGDGTGDGGTGGTPGSGMPNEIWFGLIPLNGALAFLVKRKLF